MVYGIQEQGMPGTGAFCSHCSRNKNNDNAPAPCRDGAFQTGEVIHLCKTWRSIYPRLKVLPL
ncbi:MAG: hypothetical protein F6K40_13780 [Okeania sp. SIO3I5]|uniref:hypothetical protein n=1 Tax=Okeania sp. SIO3I5 TaxID=2607805 RepID=UPI0013B751E6|nr:hypothetical protein [Okeania sp. SIO3I5]NEQ37279.1 hypothetical protein [Okeania sp. SIO3I5]